MKFKQRPPKTARKPTRKQLRKEKRVQKKANKNAYFSKLKMKTDEIPQQPSVQTVKERQAVKKNKVIKTSIIEQELNKEKREIEKLKKEMNAQRKKQLLEENEMEDRNIKKLEKQLKLNKRKSKDISKSFVDDGLDFLLEFCDPEKRKSAVDAERQFADFDENLAEDLRLMTGNVEESPKKKKKFIEDDDVSKASEEEVGDESDEEVMDESDEEVMDESDEEVMDESDEEVMDKSDEEVMDESDEEVMDESDDQGKDESDEEPTDDCNEEEKETKIKGAVKVNADGTWEDIYGRLRSKDGSVIKGGNEKYIPPAVRNKAAPVNENKNLVRLQKQLKGLINRLAESNMHNIANQVEELYMNNSRNDMNETLTTLIFDSILSPVLTPERLLMEHVLLVVIIHANVGTEVGAHFLQAIITKFDKTLKTTTDDKTLDNIVITLAQLYNFKLYNHRLMYEILSKLSENFVEKNVDCILHILKNVGFNLRKDDPSALKDLILDLQKKANAALSSATTGARAKFLLDILLAIKNNNVSKIPNYDNTYSEHLKKIMKGFIRKGNYVTQLNISLEDLLRAQEQGKWWLVGSAWTGNVANKEAPKQKAPSFSQKLLDLAKKRGMNTDLRRNIFCIIQSAEDYLDAFEKLLHLGLTGNQDREIMHLVLYCCLREKTYNPYYAYLAQKFCDYDRKFMLTIKYSIWDKLKAIGEQSTRQLSNLAKLITHLFLNKGLPISTLKVIEFGDLDKVVLRFTRQVLLGILLHEDTETCLAVFEKVAQSSALKMFRESLRLFICLFLRKNNLESEAIDEKQKKLLVTRANAVEKLLSGKKKYI